VASSESHSSPRGVTPPPVKPPRRGRSLKQQTQVQQQQRQQEQQQEQQQQQQQRQQQTHTGEHCDGTNDDVMRGHSNGSPAQTEITSSKDSPPPSKPIIPRRPYRPPRPYPPSSKRGPPSRPLISGSHDQPLNKSHDKSHDEVPDPNDHPSESRDQIPRTHNHLPESQDQLPRSDDDRHIFNGGHPPQPSQQHKASETIPPDTSGEREREVPHSNGKGVGQSSLSKTLFKLDEADGQVGKTPALLRLTATLCPSLTAGLSFFRDIFTIS